MNFLLGNANAVQRKHSKLTDIAARAVALAASAVGSNVPLQQRSPARTKIVASLSILPSLATAIVLAAFFLLALGLEPSSPTPRQVQPRLGQHASHPRGPLEVARARTRISMLATPTFTVDRYVYYLVSSEEQRDSLFERAADDEFPGLHSSIFIIRNQSDELTLGATQAEIAASGHTAELVDLRNR